MAKELTQQQSIFLEVLFEQANGNFVEAKKLAGYSDSYPTSSIVKTLQEHIIERTKEFLSRNGPKAAMAVINVMDKPEQLGTKEKLSAAKDILDRIGVSKTENINVSSNGVFLLPAKESEDD